MARRNSLIGCAWLVVVSLGGSAAWSQQPKPPKGPAAAPGDPKELAWLHGIFFREMSEYQFSLDGEKQQKLVMRREPILQYPTPTNWWGEMYLWTDQGKAAVVGSVFGMKQPNSLRRINHEFHSLSPHPLVASGGATGWQPREAGITFKPLPDAAQPAQDEAGRLAQMRDLAGRFRAGMIWGDTKVTLKRLPEPLYRYETTDKASSVVDGALFAFVGPRSGDPEVLLVLEAQRTDGAVRWHYAPARFTNREAWLMDQGKEVWRVDAYAFGNDDGAKTRRYGAFFVKAIPQEGVQN